MKKAKKTVKAAKLEPLTTDEVVTLPCNAEISIRRIFKHLKMVSFGTRTAIYNEGGESIIMVEKQSIDPLITILRRAKLSLRK